MDSNLIIKYIIEDNKIKIKYINGVEEEYLINFENKQYINNKIKKQLDNYINIKKEFNKKIKYSIVWILILSLIIFFNIYLLIISFVDIIAWLSLFLMGLSTYLNIINIKENVNILNELKVINLINNNNTIKNELNINNNIDKSILQTNSKKNINAKKLVLKKDDNYRKY